jgi:hypothetical protein
MLKYQSCYKKYKKEPSYSGMGVRKGFPEEVASELQVT